MASMEPGGGGRFAKLKSEIKQGASKGKHPRGGHNVKDAGAVAAAIGRAKYGKKKFAEMGAAGRHRAAMARKGK